MYDIDYKRFFFSASLYIAVSFVPDYIDVVGIWKKASQKKYDFNAYKKGTKNIKDLFSFLFFCIKNVIRVS